MDAGIWGFIGVVVGAVSSIATTVLVARNTSSERSKEFQRNNLIELQGSLTAAMRLTRRIIGLDDKERELEKAELNKEFMANNQSLSSHTERIIDQSLRESVRSLHTLMAGVPKIEIKDTNDETFVNLQNQFSKVMRSVGVVLRSNY